MQRSLAPASHHGAGRGDGESRSAWECIPGGNGFGAEPVVQSQNAATKNPPCGGSTPPRLVALMEPHPLAGATLPGKAGWLGRLPNLDADRVLAAGCSDRNYTRRSPDHFRPPGLRDSPTRRGAARAGRPVVGRTSWPAARRDALIVAMSSIAPRVGTPPEHLVFDLRQALELLLVKGIRSRPGGWRGMLPRA